jgi:hypothetical protein
MFGYNSGTEDAVVVWAAACLGQTGAFQLEPHPLPGRNRLGHFQFPAQRTAQWNWHGVKMEDYSSGFNSSDRQAHRMNRYGKP